MVREPPQETCDHGMTEIDYIERPDGQHKVVVCADGCDLILEDLGVPEPDNVVGVNNV